MDKQFFKLPSYLLGKVRDSIPNEQDEDSNKLLKSKKRRRILWLISVLSSLVFGHSSDHYQLAFNKLEDNKQSTFKIIKDSILDVGYVRKLDNDTMLFVNFRSEN